MLIPDKVFSGMSDKGTLAPLPLLICPDACSLCHFLLDGRRGPRQLAMKGFLALVASWTSFLPDYISAPEYLVKRKSSILLHRIGENFLHILMAIQKTCFFFWNMWYGVKLK
jgi:hypothetical protein